MVGVTRPARQEQRITMSERGAILRAIGEPLQIEDITLAPLAPDQVRVRIAASGVCHSDLSQATGALPAGTPCVLGHEGAGIVEAVGSDVHPCGTRRPCGNRVGGGVRPVLVLPARRGSPVPQRDPRHLLDAICRRHSGHRPVHLDGGVQLRHRHELPGPRRRPDRRRHSIGDRVADRLRRGHRAGAALNTAPVEHGSSVAVIGLGGVGLAALMASKVRGAAELIAVDPVASRRDAAISLGATHAVDPADDDVVKQIRGITGRRGADYIFEAVGRQATIETAIEATRRGGTTCIVGAAPVDERVSLSAYDLYMHGKTLVGCQYGSVVPGRDFPLLLNLWRTGRLPLERLITGRITLDDVNSAFDDLRHGTGIRSVIVNE